MSDIKYAYPLILNKVASPQYATATLRRARLIEWLNAAAHCRATVLAADAGYGKTTLLWQWEREVDFPCYWYKLDRNDRDWTFHISYLIEAIAKRHPGFGTRAHSMLQQLGGPGSSRPGVAAYLLAEMHERLTEPCTFIIDDWQYVNAVTEVRGLWNQILRDAPPTCRFIFSSRAKPKLLFARFKTHNGYAELRTDSLRFTQEETSQLFRDIYKNPLEASEVSELDRRTEGWAVSLQLIDVSLRNQAPAPDRRSVIRSITSSSDSDLFEFLAEEVLDQQPEPTRNFLLSTSILHQITAEVAERLGGVRDGGRELENLAQRGLFTSRLDEQSYRYHHLFREFLERRLALDRPEAEVLGLHIHAASYFETTEQWPEAIRHYLRAGLQRQAARLIGKFGEQMTAEGRLGLVDEWLQEVPSDAIKQNARLSLLYGEAAGMRGEWPSARAALERARRFFMRKGDHRMEALACIKLSAIHSDLGDADRGAEYAQLGLELVPADDVDARLRLEGNLAITRTWLTHPLDVVVRECERIATGAADRGLEHYAAIAHHNAGVALVKMGRVSDAVVHLEQAVQFWFGPPVSPFADGTDLVLAYLTQGAAEKARQLADEGVRRTPPWPRPYALARYGRAAVRAYDGRFEDAIRELTEASRSGLELGAAYSQVLASRVEFLFLGGHESGEIARVADELAVLPVDKRYAIEMGPALAIAHHSRGPCDGSCVDRGLGVLVENPNRERLTAALVRVKVGALALAHTGDRRVVMAWGAARDCADLNALGLARWWLRRYAVHARSAVRQKGGVALLMRLATADADGWRHALLDLLPSVVGADRRLVLDAIVRNPSHATIERLRTLPGRDVVEARRRIEFVRATRLFIRTFGGVSIHRGSWDGGVIRIDRKRVRGLVGVLAAHADFPLTRDSLIEMLWPEADADAAINNLNQSVFQLRRYLDPSYRGGDSPEYVISTSDEVRFNTELVRTDLADVLALPRRLAAGSDRVSTIDRALDLLRGEFLADLRYEDWVGRLQRTVHAEVRRRVLPLTEPGAGGVTSDMSVRAAGVLIQLDPYDETAVLALARALSASGRRVAARRLLVEFVSRSKQEMEDEPSDAFARGAESIGLPLESSRI